MKRVFAVLLFMLVAALCVQAEETGNYMKVINCEQWVSLREKPDAASMCLIEVPLSAIVENCRVKNKAFTYAEFGGMGGYIMSKYLEEVPMDRALMGERQVVDRGEWIPMRALSSDHTPVIQWLAPEMLVQVCVDSLDGFAYVLCNGMRGYVQQADLRPLMVETAP